ncbi:MAG: exopolysaccharide biosynthesis protein [Cyanophyceae cyanobacterium]
MARLSVELQAFFEADTCPEQVKLRDVLALAGERTFGFGFVLLSFPSALPIPAPGYSIPFGFGILLLSVQLIGGRSSLWLPRMIGDKKLKSGQMRGVLKKGIPWLQRIENISRPRWGQVSDTPLSRLVSGIFISLMAIFMLIPIPGTNTLPAIGIFVTGFGLSEKDGLITSLGWGICGLASLLVPLIITAYFYGGKSLLDWFGGF